MAQCKASQPGLVQEQGSETRRQRRGGVGDRGDVPRMESDCLRLREPCRPSVSVPGPWAPAAGGGVSPALSWGPGLV